MPKYIPIIGLEIHVELKTNSKMFCSCPNNPDRDAPNTNICEICLAHPGTLPVPNKQAIIDTVKIGRALGCEINKLSKFDRKHYFYPDLPKGYQISQYDQPIAEHGALALDMRITDNLRTAPTIGITRVHLEEDTAKLLHDDKGNTLVDFNRAGVPLVEIVSDPDIQSAMEAKAYCQELQLILRYLGVSDADMEKGHMRCEANISVQEEGKFKIENGLVKPIDGYVLSPKVELKNINSFRAIEKSIDYEIKRQTEMIGRGEFWKQQTRGWDEAKGETFMQREKETSADYRYFPEPDIPPFEPAKISGAIDLPELPSARRTRFHEEYGFSYADAYLLTADEHWGNFTEEVMTELMEWLESLPESKKMAENLTTQKQKELAKLAGGWISSKLMGAMADRKIDIRILKLKPENFAELIALIYTGRINSTNAQKILGEMLDSGVDMDPTHIMEDKGYGQVSDEGKIGKIVDEVIKSYPEQAAAFKAGKEPLIKFLLGMVMKASEGSADPAVAEKLLREKLK
ncbi:MAG: Asp-tRNA(Asn)/Glu-tRNA(Gln) amidotransferase subunit GatB [Patescibacteria group bacterium]|nr:Asp-tRNA(Asn)/Glu-tRNA(Gln) amidotransferase subunit GatB [Patescibacteria group bacterium]